MTDKDLLDTMEQIRQERFSDVPADLVRNIVIVEGDYTENRAEAYRRVLQAIDAHLSAASGGA